MTTVSSRSRVGPGASVRVCLLALLVALLLPAGSPASGRADAADPRAPLPRQASWDVPGEPYLIAKRAGADWVERVGSWTGEAATQTPPTLRAPATAAHTTVLGVQLVDAWPQEHAAIVTARQTLEEQGRLTDRELAVRVELTQDDAGAWIVVPSPPTAPASATPGTTADPSAIRRILDDGRIVLSGPARADVAAGRVDDQLLQLLTTLACRQQIEVSLFVGGYGPSRSDRPGDDPATQHATGRAADIRRIAGEPVTSEHVEGAYEVMRAARDRGALATGPILLDDRPSPLVPDHVHLAVR